MEAERDIHPGLGDLIPTKAANICLEYRVRIERDLMTGEGIETSVYFADRAEFFMDEHGIQWVKFVAKNGYAIGKEHMLRTDCNGFTFVRDETLS